MTKKPTTKEELTDMFGEGGSEDVQEYYAPKKQEKWSDEFDEMFDHYNPKNDDGVNVPTWCGSDYQAIKQFISAQLRQAEQRGFQEARDKVRMIIREYTYDEEAHSQGKCSHSSVALCSAIEQTVKQVLHDLLNEIKPLERSENRRKNNKFQVDIKASK